MGVDEHTIEVAGAPVFYRRAPAVGATPVYLHGVPTSSDDWIEMLDQSGGVAPDLLGFGRSSKAVNLEYSLPAYAEFVRQLLDELSLDRVTIIGHGWGAAVGLAFAQRQPERIARLAIIDAVPLLDSFQWPAIVRWWRRPGLGELLMGVASKRSLARRLRAGSVRPDAWSDARIDAVWKQFDQGTQRAILRLHRSADERSLAEAGAGLAKLTRSALVVWGDRDPWLEPRFADLYAQRLPHAELAHVADAGHWPWMDQPSVSERVLTFVAAAG